MDSLPVKDDRYVRPPGSNHKLSDPKILLKVGRFQPPTAGRVAFGFAAVL